MPISSENFIRVKDKLTVAVKNAGELPQSKLDECAKLILLNAQFATTFEAFTEKMQQMQEGQIAEFLLEFGKEVENLENIAEEFLNSIK